MKGFNGSPIIQPANDLPVQGMKMRVSSKDGILTIEFEKAVSWLQFNKRDAIAFVKGLAEHVRAMENIL